MAYRVKWTPKSVITLENCLEFISKSWTSREINLLKIAINKNLKRLKIHPYSSPNSYLFPDVRMAY
ncbi:MAG: hypothetical protein R2739_06145 [Chitinophagales bacterium]